MAALSVFAAVISTALTVQLSVAVLASNEPWHSHLYIQAIAIALLWELCKYIFLVEGTRGYMSMITVTRWVSRITLAAGVVLTAGSVVASLAFLRVSESSLEAHDEAAEQARKEREEAARMAREQVRHLGEQIEVVTATYSEDMRTGYRTRARELQARLDGLQAEYARAQAEYSASTAGYTPSTHHNAAETRPYHAVIAIMIEVMAALTALNAGLSKTQKTATGTAEYAPSQDELVLEALRTGAVPASTRAIRERYKVGTAKATKWLKRFNGCP
jgi:hypothetical protein